MGALAVEFGGKGLEFLWVFGFLEDSWISFFLNGFFKKKLWKSDFTDGETR
jgi:hypothetical protein